MKLMRRNKTTGNRDAVGEYIDPGYLSVTTSGTDIIISTNNPTGENTTATVSNGILVTGNLAVGATSLVLENPNITTSSMFECYTSNYNIRPKNISVAAGKATITFIAQTEAVTVYLLIKG